MVAGGHQDPEQPAQPAQPVILVNFVEEVENIEEQQERAQHRRQVMDQRLQNLGSPRNIPVIHRHSQARTYEYAYDHAVDVLGFQEIPPGDGFRGHPDVPLSGADAYAMVFSKYYTGARAHDPKININTLALEAHALGIVSAVDEEIYMRGDEHADFRIQVFNALNIQIPENLA